MPSPLTDVTSSLDSRFNLHCNFHRLIQLGASLVGCYTVVNLFQRAWRRRRLAHIREQKLASASHRKGEILQRIPSATLSASEREVLLTLPYPKLRQQLQSGELSALRLLAALQVKALAVDRELNCVNEVLPNAHDLASQLEERQTEKTKGRLHGIPVSIKEGIPVEGLDATGGNTSAALKPRDRSAVIVRALIAEGAIPFVQTNMAQGGRGVDCQNALFGETLHPMDPSRSPGGSSGGEAALIAAGGSLLGLGSDAGGSIRIPASLCGIFGFKPTAARISHRDLVNGPLSRLRIVETSYGPLAQHLDAAIDMMRVLCSSSVFRLDPTRPAQLFDEAVLTDSRPLTIGYYTSLDDPELFPPTPAAVRAVESAVGALIARGHHLRPWSPPAPADATRLTMEAYAVDGGRSFLRSTARELLTSDLVARRRMIRLGYTSRTILGHLVSWLYTPLAGRHILASRGAPSVDALLQWCVKADTYRQKFIEQWEADGLDAIICPVLPFGAALPRGETHPLRLGQLYASLYNFLDCPAGSVPVTRVTAEDLIHLQRDYPSNDPLLRRLVRSQAGTEGLPLSVQVVTPPWQDELCLRAMRELRDALQS